MPCYAAVGIQTSRTVAPPGISPLGLMLLAMFITTTTSNLNSLASPKRHCREPTSYPLVIHSRAQDIESNFALREVHAMFEQLSDETPSFRWTDALCGGITHPVCSRHRGTVGLSFAGHGGAQHTTTDWSRRRGPSVNQTPTRRDGLRLQDLRLSAW